MKHDNHELMAVTELAAKVYSNELLRGVGKDRDSARGYIAERRLFAPMVESFRIGYSPKSSGVPWILSRIPERKLLVAAGILNQSSEGRLYDPMEGRVVFPQVTPTGRYVGFVGRDITSNRADKYLSTPSTPIFRRAEVLYRIDLARPHIQAAQTAIVVEGLLDAALMFQVGIRNVVSTGTKAMTDAQAQILARYAKSVEVMFDNEVQGREGFKELRKRRGGYFKDVRWREYPAKFNDPADWVAAQIDQSITHQQAAVTYA